MESTKLVVSIDTEEDTWGWRSSGPFPCENILQLPRLVRLFERLHVRPTFFVSYQVLRDPSARSVLREIANENWVELGAHVHPWNTPPEADGVPRSTMLFNYPRETQRAMLRSTSEAFESVVGRAAKSFRAGRFGFGASTAELLLAAGYESDSSVTPYWDWSRSSAGQNYVGAPLEVYQICPASGVMRHTPCGGLFEVPLSGGYTRVSAHNWNLVARMIENRVSRATRLGGMIGLFGGPRRVLLSPEGNTYEHMVDLSERILSAGVGHLHLFFHSSSLTPGLTPFSPTAADVEGLYQRLERLIERLQGLNGAEPATVTEVVAAAARKLGAPGPSDRAPALEKAAVEDTHVEWRPTPRSREVFRLDHHGGMKGMLGYWAHMALFLLGAYREYGRVDWGRVRRVVFVCRGNICRSAYAEAWARATGLSAASIGVEAITGKGANETASRLAVERDISLIDHQTTPMKAFDAEEGDLFLAMEPSQARNVLEHPWNVDHQVSLLGLWIPLNGPIISDPYGRSDRSFFDSFELIEAGIARIRRLAGLRHADASPEAAARSGKEDAG